MRLKVNECKQLELRRTVINVGHYMGLKSFSEYDVQEYPLQKFEIENQSQAWGTEQEQLNDGGRASSGKSAGDIRC